MTEKKGKLLVQFVVGGILSGGVEAFFQINEGVTNIGVVIIILLGFVFITEMMEINKK